MNLKTSTLTRLPQRTTLHLYAAQRLQSPPLLNSTQMSSLTAVKAAQAGNRVIPVHKKYTLQSVGIWERVRRLLAVDPTRSNGVPLNPQFRNPTPGSNEPFSFTDPVTLPAGDIAGNPYWKRDSRRNYARPSVVAQSDVVALLSVGSALAPRTELVGEAGKGELVKAEEAGQKGLASWLREQKGKNADLSTVLAEGGMPPLPSGASMVQSKDKYELTEENAYPEQYPCRTFQ